MVDLNKVPKKLTLKDANRIVHTHVSQKTINLQHTFLEAVKDAGGSVESFDWKHLERMSALDLLNVLAHNLKVMFGNIKPHQIDGEMSEGFYWISRPDGSEKCLVRLYYNPDACTKGLGFGIWDGCGFVPISDIPKDSILIPLEM